MPDNTITPHTFSADPDRPYYDGGVIRHKSVECVEMPCCGFTFDAGHRDLNLTTYTCPLCSDDPNALAANA